MNKHLLIVLPFLVSTTWLAPCTEAHAAGAGLTLTWSDNSSNEDGFGVERKLGTTGTYAEVGRVGANVPTYSDSNLAFNQSYCYRVYAYNAAGKSLYSPEGCGTTKADPIPSAPGKPTVTPQ